MNLSHEERRLLEHDRQRFLGGILTALGGGYREADPGRFDALAAEIERHRVTDSEKHDGLSAVSDDPDAGFEDLEKSRRSWLQLQRARLIADAAFAEAAAKLIESTADWCRSSIDAAGSELGKVESKVARGLKAAGCDAERSKLAAVNPHAAAAKFQFQVRESAIVREASAALEGAKGVESQRSRMVQLLQRQARESAQRLVLWQRMLIFRP